MSETVPAPEKPPGILEDFLDVFVAPAALFRRRVDGKFGLALLVLTVLTAVLFFATRGLIAPIMDAEITRSMAANPNLTPEQIQAARGVAGTFATIAVVIGMPIAVLVLGLVTWIVGRLVSAKLSYAQGATIAAFSLFPKLVEGVVGAVQAAMMDEASLTSRFKISLGMGRFLDSQTINPALLAFLGRVDVFTLWVTILIAIGLKQMGRITTGQAAIGAAIIWAVGSLPTLLPALRQ